MTLGLTCNPSPQDYLRTAVSVPEGDGAKMSSAKSHEAVERERGDSCHDPLNSFSDTGGGRRVGNGNIMLTRDCEGGTGAKERWDLGPPGGGG